MSNLTEEQIMQNWSGNKNKPLVSISTLTFNHANYIEDALDSFLAQKTSFAFEILIHDDASSDGTAEIIRRYEKKFPNIVKPIIQEKNQWSQGIINLNGIYNISRAKGKYIAFCEGDDWWNNKDKLQQSYDFLEKKDDYSAVVHQTRMVNADGVFIRLFSDFNEDMTITSLNSYLEFPHTSSYFFRNPLFNINYQKKYELVSGWDKSYALYMLSIGKVKYINKEMSCYRYVNTFGSSWSTSMRKENKTQMIINAELAQLRQIREYGLSINMELHYYRNVMMYSIKWFITKPSKNNFILFFTAFRSCHSKFSFLLWFIKKIYQKIF